MKLKVVIALVCASLLTVALVCIRLLVGFGGSNNDRLKVVKREFMGTILYDTETGVEYWISNMNSSFLVVLLDRDGKPSIYDEVESEDYSD